MIHPATRLERIDDVIGFGVVATEEIPAGTLLWARDRFDNLVAANLVDRLPAPLRHRFRERAYLHSDDEWILCWDHARFVNHSCDPNTVVVGDVEIACRSISAGEQITNDYAFFRLAPDEEFACGCAAPQCRVWIDSVQPQRWTEADRTRRRVALAQLQPAEHQPLWALIGEAERTELRRQQRSIAGRTTSTIILFEEFELLGSRR